MTLPITTERGGHTPGPLVARRINGTERPWAVINPNGPHGDEFVAGYLNEADATLYAAAPDLLEALNLMTKETELSGNHEAKDFGWPKAYQAARAAILKATGTQP